MKALFILNTQRSVKHITQKVMPTDFPPDSPSSNRYLFICIYISNLNIYRSTTNTKSKATGLAVVVLNSDAMRQLLKLHK